MLGAIAVVGVLVISPGRVDVQLFESARGVPIWGTCDMVPHVAPDSPWVNMSLSGGCSDQLSVFWGPLLPPGSYSVARVNGCPLIQTVGFATEYNCNPVGVKSSAWTEIKKLYR